MPLCNNYYDKNAAPEVDSRWSLNSFATNLNNIEDFPTPFSNLTNLKKIILIFHIYYFLI